MPAPIAPTSDVLTVDVPPPNRRTFRRMFVAPPDLGATTVGLLFWAESLRPSLLPRPAVMQGVLSAVALLVGYGVAGLVLLAFRAQRHRTGWFEPPKQWRQIGRLTLAVAAVLVVLGSPFVWLNWQNSQRDLISMPHLETSAIVTAVAVTVIVAVVLLALARVIGFAVGRLDGWLARRIGRLAAHGIVTVAIVLLVVTFTNRVVIDGLVGGIDATFAAGDQTTEDGVRQPTSPLQSGGPATLVPWDTLGRQGRSFVGGVTTTEQIQAFAGPDAKVTEPIRVYVGLASAPTPKARADLAVAELERTGAFDRRVLCVVTVTGTGWINPVAAAALEYLRNGDTAIVGQQYSHLPSWISTLVDQDNAIEAGRALNDAVYAKWSTLPAATRPKLLVFGESLGSFGSEAAFEGATAAASVHAATSRSDGVLWVAPTNGNPVWGQVTDARDPSSPVWQPVYGTDGQVRVAIEPGQLPIAPPDHPPTVVYLQHASDPVTWWNPSIAWAPPAWTRDPRGPDIPAQLGWFPVVTWTQVSADLIEGFNTPPGHGHNFNNAFAAGFASQVAPAGWTAADTARLDVVLARIADGEPSL